MGLETSYGTWLLCVQWNHLFACLRLKHNAVVVLTAASSLAVIHQSCCSNPHTSVSCAGKGIFFSSSFLLLLLLLFLFRGCCGVFFWGGGIYFLFVCLFFVWLGVKHQLTYLFFVMLCFSVCALLLLLFLGGGCLFFQNVLRRRCRFSCMRSPLT